MTTGLSADLAERRKALRADYAAGRLDAAAAGFAALLADLRQRGEIRPHHHLDLALCHFSANRMAEAAAAIRAGLSEFPADPELHENLGVCLGRLGDNQGAVASLTRAVELGSAKPNVEDALTQCYQKLGDLERARRHGIRSLTLKAANAEAIEPRVRPPEAPPPPFEPTHRQANIIAYSLWGGDARYLAGAVRNALLIPEIYPGWLPRFYVGRGVPPGAIDQLRKLGAEVVPREGPDRLGEGLFWRFEVVGDPAVERFLIRDADSIVNTQERAAVDDWLASGRWFHIMRDWWSHTDLMLAGLWGGCGGVLPPLAELRAAFVNDRATTFNIDQDFLRLMIWPIARSSCLIHDSYFDCLGSRPFPPAGRLPPGMHVGQDHRARKIRPMQGVDVKR